MEAENDTERPQVVNDDFERGSQTNPVGGSSADLCRDYTTSTDVGSIPPPNDGNISDNKTSETDLPNLDSPHNNNVSSVANASNDMTIVDPPKKMPTISSDAPPPSNHCASDQFQPVIPGNDRATLDQKLKPLDEKSSPCTDTLKQPLKPPQAIEATVEPPSFPVRTTAANVASNSTKPIPFKPPISQQATGSSCPNLGDTEQAQSDQIKLGFLGPAPVDENTVVDEAVRALRAPLVDTYAPYIEPSDTSLAMARSRLRTAIEQTRKLRAAFSERVYDKYRVCLRPPPSTNDILNNIYADPVAASARLQEITRKLNEEKEVEKKEAHELNAQWAASNPVSVSVHSANADNAEQLMYISAGLSLVILPEQDVDDIDMSRFHDRAPIDTDTGQRIRSISVAAAAAGELIIDRARKGAASIQERQRRRQLQLSSGDNPEMQNRTLSQLQFFASSSTDNAVVPAASVPGTKPVAKTATVKLPPAIAPKTVAAAATAKSNRSRTPPAMSANNLLSLSPMSEELRPGVKTSAATAALIARGVGCPTLLKSPQQRLKHPHPDSLGGRRQSQSLKNYAAYLSISLPPVPTPKERCDSKVLPVVNDKSAGMPRAVSALHRVLAQFVPDPDTTNAGSKSEISTLKDNDNVASFEDCDRRRFIRKRKVTEIGLLQGLQRIGEHRAQIPTKAVDLATVKGQLSSNPNVYDVPGSVGMLPDQGQDDNSVDPLLALCVLQAVGLVRKAETASVFDLNQSKLVDTDVSDCNLPFFQKLRDIRNKVSSRKRNFSDAFLSMSAGDEKALNGRTFYERENDFVSSYVGTDSVVTNVDEVTTPPIECPASPSAKSIESCPIASLRGGGDVLLNSPSDGSAMDELHASLSEKTSNDSASEQAQEARSEPLFVVSESSPHTSVPPPLDAVTLQMPSSTTSLPTYAGQAVVWDEQSPQTISLLNPRLPLPDDIYAGVAVPSAVLSPQRGGGMLGPQTNHEHYHHRPAASALQLAHQLRHASVSMAGLAPRAHQSGAADLSEYIGSLHSPPARGYDWSSFGAAAMAASIGLAPHRALADQARVLLSREQQTAVAQAVAAHRHAVSVRGAATVSAIPPHHAAMLFNGVPTHGFAAPPSSRFAHLGAQSAASAAAFLHSSGPSRIVGRTDMPSPPLLNTASHSDPSHEPQSSQKATPSRIKKGAGQTDGIEVIEENLSDAPLSHDNKTQNINSEVQTSRKRKNSESVNEPASPVDQTCESLDTVKRRKVANPEANPCDGTEITPQIQSISESVEMSGANSAETILFDKPSLAFGPSLKSDGNLSSSPQNVAPPGRESKISEKQPSPTLTPLASNESNAMHFVLPPVPPSLPFGLAELVRRGRVHEAVASIVGVSGESLVPMKLALIEYLVSVGSNVPIPKALVSNPLKDRLGSPVFKNSTTNGNHSIPREVIVSTILVWLWNQHEEAFQQAFAVNGRIDVDPCCKWLIQAAIDASLRALTIEIADAAARGGPMASALAGHVKFPAAADDDRVTPASARLDVLIASTVSKALMTELEIDTRMDSCTLAFQELVEYLDQCRECALFCKSRERGLLAALVSRRSTMSESFSHAYVSAMVRAGLALGHSSLSEAVQNEGTKTSTMIPYDIIEDEYGFWEDPCRPTENVSQHHSGDDLMKLAHARAMIQKSLKKLQDRHHMKGGVPRPGPYADPVSTEAAIPSGSANKGSGPGSQSQRAWSKRRASSFSEPPIPPGTGSGEATSKSLYDPRHFSAPLMWLVDDVENTPYGRHNVGARPLSIAPTQSLFRGADSKRIQKEKTLQTISSPPTESESRLQRSTCEISWSDVAGIFQQVTLPSTSSAKREVDDTPERDPKSIIAPFCRKLEGLLNPDEDESSEEEDLSDDAILRRHQVVLDRMKQRLNTFLETRKKAQQRRKSSKIRA